MSPSFENLDLPTIKEVLNQFPNPVALTQQLESDAGKPYKKVIYLNPAFTSALGYDINDLPTEDIWFEKTYPDVAYRKYVFNEWFELIEKARKTGKNLIALPNRVVCKNGSEKWFQVTTQLEPNLPTGYSLTVFVEIHTPESIVLQLQNRSQQLIQNYEELAKSEKTLKETQTIAQIGSWEIDFVGGGLKWSDEMFNIFGEDKESFIPTLDDFYSRLSPDNAQTVANEIQRALDTGERQRVVVDASRTDGSVVTLEIYGQSVLDESGTPTRLVGSTLDITDRVELQKQNNELADLIRVAEHETYIVDYETDHYVYVNESACHSTGYSEKELLSFSIFDINPYLTPEQVNKMKAASLNLNKINNVSIHQRKDGSTYPVHATIQRITYNGRPCYAIFDADISQLKEAEEQIQNQLNLLQNIVDTVPVRIFWKDWEGVYLGANELFLQDAGLEQREQLIGKTDKDLTWGETDADSYQADDRKVMTSKVPKLRFEEEQTNEEGNTIYLSTSKVPLQNSQGEVIGVLGTYEDITDRKRIEQTLIQQQDKLHYQAHYDLLTGLPNRLLMQDRLEHAVKQSKRNGEQFALIFIDLDQFKQINDAMGHEVGDRVLKEIAEKFKAAVRESDTLARLGGDEFTVIMENIEHSGDASILAQKIIEISKEPVTVNQQTFSLSSSLGISIYPKDAETPDELLKSADAAMYRAKDQGRDNFQFYTEDMTQAAFEHVAMQASLRQAIIEEEFVVYYQPQVNAHSSSLIGMEALVRWQHPSLGLVMPNKFIPLAEETGMIVDLDRLVMKTAMQQWVDWKNQGMEAGMLSINIAAKQLQKGDFIRFLNDCLQQTQCAPEWLCLELTESDIMKNLEAMCKTLSKVAELGISIAVDDFGTGYSSLAYLKRLPVGKLKIDRSFIKDLPDDDEDRTITRTIITMAESLGLDVIAEGVETPEQRAFLLESGCYDIQGYLYSKPVPKEDVPAFIDMFNTKL